MPYDDKIKDEAKRLYLSGMTYKEVANELNLKIKTVQSWGKNINMEEDRKI